MTNPTLQASTRHLPSWQLRLVQASVVDTAAVALLLGFGVLAYGAVFGSWRGYAAAALGVAVGMTVQHLGARHRWGAFTRVSLLIVAYLLLAGPLALPSTTIGGVVPTLETLQRSVLLSWESWRDLLTVALPAGQFEGPAAVPLIAGLVAGAACLALARTERWPWLALLPALLFLVTGVLWGGPTTPWALAQGIGFVVVTAVWLTTAGDRGTVSEVAQVRFGPTAVAPTLRHRWIPVAGVLALTSVVAVVALPAVAGTNRFLLRDQVEPPLQLEDYPSPLTLYRDLETTLADETLVRVDGLPQGARLEIATVDLYDGNVYTVSESSALFSRAGEIVEPTGFSDLDAPVTTLDVTIGDYRGPWIPGGGDIRGVRFAGGEDAERRAEGLYINPATGTALTTAGLEKGAAYEIDVALPAPRPRVLPDDLAVADVDVPPTLARFDELSTRAAELAGDADSPATVAQTIADNLSTRGFFADGTLDESLAGHTTARIRQLLADPSGQMVGDDEQYAVGMALLARELGLPARVVMGLYPTTYAGGPVDLTGDDAHVWTEVAFDDVGWVAFDPTPSDDQRPDDERPRPLERNDPQVLPPPEVDDSDDRRPPARAESERNEEEEEEEPNPLGALLALIAAGAGGIVLLTAPLWGVLLFKALRRRRRRRALRPADRVSGSWNEVADVAVDLGRPVPAYATRREAVPALVGGADDTERSASATAVLEAYADQVDAAVFGAQTPTDEDAARLWGEAEEARRSLLASAGARSRLRARLSWRSVRHSTAPGKDSR